MPVTHTQIGFDTQGLGVTPSRDRTPTKLDGGLFTPPFAAMAQASDAPPTYSYDADSLRARVEAADTTTAEKILRVHMEKPDFYNAMQYLARGLRESIDRTIAIAIANDETASSATFNFPATTLSNLDEGLMELALRREFRACRVYLCSLWVRIAWE